MAFRLHRRAVTLRHDIRAVVHGASYSGGAVMGNKKTVGECPKCNGVMRTTDSRASAVKGVMKRRIKKCLECGYVCTTHEVFAYDREGESMDYRQKATEFIDAVHELAVEKFGTDGGGLRGSRQHNELPKGSDT